MVTEGVGGEWVQLETEGRKAGPGKVMRLLGCRSPGVHWGVRAHRGLAGYCARLRGY